MTDFNCKGLCEFDTFNVSFISLNSNLTNGNRCLYGIGSYSLFVSGELIESSRLVTWQWFVAARQLK